MPVYKRKRAYVKTAERALGHELPEGAVVHHIDRDRTNGLNSNLVILQNQAEHAALHRRLRIQQAGGDPWHDGLCGMCKKTKPLMLFIVSKISSTGRGNTCLRCMADYVHAYFNRRKGVPEDYWESPAERSERNRIMANRRWGNVSRV